MADPKLKSPKSLIKKVVMSDEMQDEAQEGDKKESPPIGKTTSSELQLIMAKNVPTLAVKTGQVKTGPTNIVAKKFKGLRIKSSITQALKREPVRQDWSSKQFRSIFIYTILIFLNMFGFGMCYGMLGPCMADLEMLYGFNGTAKMPYVPISQNFGYATGAIVGLFAKAYNRQLTVAVASFLMAIFTAATPLYQKIFVYCGVFLQGMGVGCVATSYQVWLFEMWPQCASSALLTASFTYGLGTIAAPVLAKPFLLGDNNSTTTDQRKASLLVPYITIGSIEAVPALLFLILLYVLPYRYAEPVMPRFKSISSKSSTGGSARSGGTMFTGKTVASQNTTVTVVDTEEKFDAQVPLRTYKLIAGLIFLALYYAGENGYALYASKMWQVLPIKLSGPDAASVAVTLTSLYTIAPLITAAVSLKVTPDTIISYHYGIIGLGWSLVYFGKEVQGCIYGGSALLGYGFSPMQGTIFCFADRYFKLTERWSSAYLCAACLSLATVSIILINFPLDGRPNMLFYITAGYLLFSLAIFCAIKFWVYSDNKPNPKPPSDKESQPKQKPNHKQKPKPKAKNAKSKA